MIPTEKATLVRMQAAMKMSELYALKWIAMATTGVAGRRNVHTGNRKLTPDELTKEALETATTHIWRIEKIANNIASLLEEVGVNGFSTNDPVVMRERLQELINNPKQGISR